MTADDLLEEALGAWRPVDRDGAPRMHPAWADLPVAERERLFDELEALRTLEAALDPGGLSATGHAVLRRILAGR